MYIYLVPRTIDPIPRLVDVDRIDEIPIERVLVIKLGTQRQQVNVGRHKVRVLCAENHF